ncbi:MAG: hypothetical protein RLZZ546_3105, partial [Bacteroidota bacterium]
ITLNFVNEKAKLVFKEISKQSGAIFSYSDLDDNKRISIQADNIRLEKIIEILENELEIKILVKENYLILKSRQKKVDQEILINGVIYGPSGEDPLSDASVYLKHQKILVNTNSDGKFSFKIPHNIKQIKINLAKENFIDTSIIIVVSRDQNLSIKMKSFPREMISSFDTLGQKNIFLKPVNIKNQQLPPIKYLSQNQRFWEKQKSKNVNLINISDTLLNVFSISFIPSISTNKLLSYHTKNNVAINIIGGHSKGSNGLEIAGVYNYADGDVKGLQISGAINRVSGNIIGNQISGLLNAVNGSVSGLQIAGIANLNDSTTNGVQIAGIFQKTLKSEGLQISGLINKAVEARGVQIGGLINTVDSAKTNLQIAGLYNKASTIEGLQISGMANMVDTLAGIQIGLFNKANYIKSGFMIGIINYAKNGYHKIELSYNDQGTAAVGYRSGWAPLHFHYFGGINLKSKSNYYLQAGAGLASAIKLNKRLNLETDLNIRNTYDFKNLSYWKFNMHSQCLVGLSFQLFKSLGIKTGMTINHFWYDHTSELYNYIASTIGNEISSKMGENRNQKIWLGWQLGLNF